MKLLGIILIIASCLMWATLFAVPFLPVSNLAKAGVVTFILVVAEIIFWAGCLLAGAEWAKRVWERWTARGKTRGGERVSDQRR